MDSVLFSGNGTTAAIHKLISSLGLNVALPTGVPGYEEEVHRPVVFTSSYEHHSNLLPWRESCAEVVTVQYHPVSGVCLEDLAYKLAQPCYSRRKLIIGAFAAASNVTGQITAVDDLASMLHRVGGYIFLDMLRLHRMSILI